MPKSMNNAVSADLAKTLRNIAEKVDWAERSLARLEEAAIQKDAVAVQDHFWSFLHALQLMWFYIERYFSSIGSSGGSSKTFVQNWITNTLDTDEQLLWRSINELRTSDVHVGPVVTEEKTEAQLLARDGKLLIRDGKLLARTRTQYVVTIQGSAYECQEIARRWISLARRMVEYFKHNAPK